MVVQVSDVRTTLTRTIHYNIKSFNFRRKLLEFHDIASKSACFITKDVFDLTQFFVDAGRLSTAEEVLFVVKYLQVILHEGALEKFDHFKSDKKRYRHKISI